MKQSPILASVLIIMVLFVVSACKAPIISPDNSTTGNVIGTPGACPANGNSTDPNCQIPIDTNKTPIVTELNITGGTAANEAKDASFTINGVEGDLLAIKPNAYSPDGAKLFFSFSKPFNDNGLWQTKNGDAGKYLITVTASDGALQTSESVLVVVKPANKAPVVECPETVNVKETETVDLKCNIFDPDGDEVVVDYSGWMTSPRYQTTYDDAGSHTVVVRAADPTHVTQKTVTIMVENVNRPPAFTSQLKDMKVMETDVVALNVTAYDADGDKVAITYSTPFDNTGIWKTKIGDAGTYPVSVVASDGSLVTKQEFSLKVSPVNTAPVLKSIADITVSEGDTIHIPVEATDREGDPLVVTFSGFMAKDTYVTNYDDAYPKGCGVRGCTAKYITTVTVSDGSLSTSQDVNIYVKDKPRPPVFMKP